MKRGPSGRTWKVIIATEEIGGNRGRFEKLIGKLQAELREPSGRFAIHRAKEQVELSPAYKPFCSVSPEKALPPPPPPPTGF